MKKLIFILLSVSLLAIGACKKKEKDTTGSPSSGANSNSFTLKKDGTPYAAGQILVSIQNEYIGIQAHLSPTQENVQTYSMSLNEHVQPGTYNDDNSPISLSSICAFIHIYNGQQVFYMDNGELTVLSNDTVAKKIEFNFKMKLQEDLGTGIVQITEGHAKISY